MEQYGDEKVIKQLHEWVPTLKSREYELIEENENSYRLDTEKAYGKIHFYDFGVMELIIFDKETEESPFYLHFEMDNFNHCKEMINDMIKELADMQKAKTTHILLSCTGGLTTGFFANKLNEAAKTLSMDYDFNAVSYVNVYVEGFNYDGIFLAPQIEYEYEKIRKALEGKIVRMIPNTMFAKFDAGEMLMFVKETMEEAQQETQTKQEKLKRLRKTLRENADKISDALWDKLDPEEMNAFARYKLEQLRKDKIRLQMKNLRKILVVAYYSSVDGRHLCFRYYRNGQIIEEGSIKKSRQKDIRDIVEIIKVARAKYPELNEVALALPGRVSLHHYTFPAFTDEHPDFRQYLKDMFPNLSFYLLNHTNAVAAGYSALNDGFEDMVYLYQPIGDYNSMATVRNGAFINGRRGMVGEMVYLDGLFKYDEDPKDLIKTPEGTLKFMTPYLISLIAIAGPDKMVLHGPLLPSLSSIHDELVKVLPEEGVPELYELDDEKEYMITGAMLSMIRHGDQI